MKLPKKVEVMDVTLRDGFQHVCTDRSKALDRKQTD